MTQPAQPQFSSAVGQLSIGQSPIGTPPPQAGPLYRYLQDTQRLLNDPKEEKFNRDDLMRYINAGRRKIAAESQCIRFLMPSSGSLASVWLDACGEGYTSTPTVVVTGPDAWGVGWKNAKIEVGINSLGQVCSVTLVDPGSGFIAPTVTIEGGGGSGAKIGFKLTPFVSTLASQEVYRFQDYNAILPQGLREILAIQNVAVSWGGIKPTMRHLDWSGFQAYLRSYNTQSTNWPAIWAQYGQGTQGSIYLNPIPYGPLQMEWDCYVLPDDLRNDEDPEWVPYPFSNAIPYYAAWWASVPVSSDMANYFDALYKRAIKEARAWTDIVVFPDFYAPDIA